MRSSVILLRRRSSPIPTASASPSVTSAGRRQSGGAVRMHGERVGRRAKAVAAGRGVRNGHGWGHHHGALPRLCGTNSLGVAP